jgi:UDP-glucose 6-dehydrogenase
MKIGIIGIGNLGIDLLTSLAEKQHEIYVSDVDGDNIEVIKNSDVIFCCVNTEILPSNIYDIKNVMEVVEDFGVAFEEEVPLVDKIVVICSTVNPGDTKEISDILTQMNLRVCYLPLSLPIKNQEKIIVGSIDPYTVNIVGTLISDIQEKPTNIVSMTSKSAELCKLALGSYMAYKINFANKKTFYI